MRIWLVACKTHDGVRNDSRAKFSIFSVWPRHEEAPLVVPFHFVIVKQNVDAIMDGADLEARSLLDFCTFLFFLVNISKVLKFLG